MSYPKPLSEKSINRMYREANITENTSEFLHKLFQAAANLYGSVPIRLIWELCKECSEQYGITGIKRKDIINFSSIARRESDVTYYVFEIDELYSAEKRADLDRFIVHKDLISVAGYAKNYRFYRLEDSLNQVPYYLPDDILSYVNPKISEYDAKLLAFLGNLKVTAKEVEINHRKKIKCEHYGESLGNFSYMNEFDKYDYRYYSGEMKEHPRRNEKIIQEIIRRNDCTEAEKIFRDYKYSINLGGTFGGPMSNVESVTKELNEVGVQLTMRQMKSLLNLLMDVNNHSNLWCNCGWAPTDMAKNMPRQPISEVSLGPGIKQAIAEGKMDLKEIEDGFNKMGITVKDFYS